MACKRKRGCKEREGKTNRETMRERKRERGEREREREGGGGEVGEGVIGTEKS